MKRICEVSLSFNHIKISVVSNDIPSRQIVGMHNSSKALFLIGDATNVIRLNKHRDKKVDKS